MRITPTIDDRIFEVAPNFKAVSLLATCNGIKDAELAHKYLQDACTDVSRGQPPWVDAHLEAWATAFRQFGAKPQRTPCSASALRKRVVRSGEAPRVNPVVDIYNAVSLKYAVPVGGEDCANYHGSPRLTIATGCESFETVRNGTPTVETPDVGEVIWRDNDGVTCRRWNWRQCIRTQIKPDTTDMWFILESLDPMSAEKLQEAADEFVVTCESVLADFRFESTWIGNT